MSSDSNPIFRELFIQHLSDSPQLIAFAEANLIGCNESVLERLGQLVDESDYELRQWVQSLSILGHWLESHSLQMAMDDQIGYVSCSVEALGSGTIYQDLPTIIQEMLDKYGCDLAVKK